MNMKKYREALVNLEQLHWHLHLNGGPDLWTAELLRQFKAAVKDNAAEPDKDRVFYIGDEPPPPAA
jgi:hypothetical protein